MLEFSTPTKIENKEEYTKTLLQYLGKYKNEKTKTSLANAKALGNTIVQDLEENLEKAKKVRNYEESLIYYKVLREYKEVLVNGKEKQGYL